MDIIKEYNAALDAHAAEFHQAAEQARARGDERGHSLALMQESMLGDMLKQLGRVEHVGRRGLLQKQIDRCEAQAAKLRQRDDFDGEDQERIKAQTIRWALETLTRLEAEHE